mgnify:FL=1
MPDEPVENVDPRPVIVPTLRARTQMIFDPPTPDQAAPRANIPYQGELLIPTLGLNTLWTRAEIDRGAPRSEWGQATENMLASRGPATRQPLRPSRFATRKIE